MLKSITNSIVTRGGIAILNLFILLLASNYLGSDVIGQISLLILNLTIIQLVNEIYTGSALIHFIAKYNLKTIYHKGVLFSIFALFVSNLIIFIFKIGVHNLFIHCFIISIFQNFNGFNANLILGKQKIKSYNITLLLQPVSLIMALLIQVFVFNLSGVIVYVTALYFAFIIPFIYSQIIVFNLLYNNQHSSSEFKITKLLKTGLFNQLGNLAYILTNRYSYYVISIYTLVGVYANSTSLIESVLIITNGVAPIILTRTANSNHSSKNLEFVISLSQVVFFLSVLLVVIIYFIPNSFFEFLLGGDFVEVKKYMLYLSPGILALSCSNLYSHYFSANGKQLPQLLSNLIGVAFTICLSNFFVSKYQLKGASITASIAYCIEAVLIVVIFYYYYKIPFYKLFVLKAQSLKDILKT